MQLLTRSTGRFVEAAEFSAGPKGDVGSRLHPGFQVQYRYSQHQEDRFLIGENCLLISTGAGLCRMDTPYIEVQGFGEILLDRFYRPKKDRTLSLQSGGYTDNGQLRIANGSGAAASIESYDRGISLHSRTRLAYDLPERCSPFSRPRWN